MEEKLEKDEVTSAEQQQILAGRFSAHDSYTWKPLIWVEDVDSH